jgi:hypothetical protein
MLILRGSHGGGHSSHSGGRSSGKKAKAGYNPAVHGSSNDEKDKKDHLKKE